MNRTGPTTKTSNKEAMADGFPEDDASEDEGSHVSAKFISEPTGESKQFIGERAPPEWLHSSKCQLVNPRSRGAIRGGVCDGKVSL